MKIKIFVSWRSASFPENKRSHLKRLLSKGIENFSHEGVQYELFFADKYNESNTPKTTHPKQAGESDILLACLTEDFTGSETCIKEFKKFIEGNRDLGLEYDKILGKILFLGYSVDSVKCEYDKLINSIGLKGVLKEDIVPCRLNENSENCSDKDQKISTQSVNTINNKISKIIELIIKENKKNYPGLNKIDSTTKMICISDRQEELRKFANLLSNRTDKSSRLIFLFGPSGVGKSSFIEYNLKNEHGKNKNYNNFYIVTPGNGHNIYQILLYPYELYHPSSCFFKNARYDIDSIEKFNIFEKKYLNHSLKPSKPFIVVDQFEVILRELNKDTINNILQFLKYFSEKYCYVIVVSSVTEVLANFINSSDISWKTQQEILNSSMLLAAAKTPSNPKITSEEPFFDLYKKAPEHLQTAIWQHLHWVASQEAIKSDKDWKKPQSWEESVYYFINKGLNNLIVCNCQSCNYQGSSGPSAEHKDAAYKVKLDLLAALVNISSTTTNLVKKYRPSKDLKFIYDKSYLYHFGNPPYEEHTNISKSMVESFSFYGNMFFITQGEDCLYFLHDLIPNAFDELKKHFSSLINSYETFDDLIQFSKTFNTDNLIGSGPYQKLQEKFNEVVKNSEKNPDFEINKVILNYERILLILNQFSKINDPKEQLTAIRERIRAEQSINTASREISSLEKNLPNMLKEDIVSISSNAFKAFLGIKHISNIIDNKDLDKFYLNNSNKVKPSNDLINLFFNLDRIFREIISLSHGIDKIIDFDDKPNQDDKSNQNNSKEIINAVAINPKNLQWILSASYDYKVRITNLENRFTKVVHTHTDRVYDCCFSLDGKYAISCGYDGYVRISLLADNLDLSSKVIQYSFQLNYRLYHVRACEIKGQHIFIAIGGGPDFNNKVKTGCIIYGFLEHISQSAEEYYCGEDALFDFDVMSSEDRVVFCTAGYDNKLRIFELYSEIDKLTIYEKDSVDASQGLNHVKFTNDGNYIVAAGINKDVLIYQIEERKFKSKEEKSIVKPMRGHRARVRKCQILERAETSSILIASCSSDRTVRSWEVMPKSNTELDIQQKDIMVGHDDWIRDLVFEPNYISSIGRDGRVFIWDQYGESLFSLHLFNKWGRSLCTSRLEDFMPLIAVGEPNRLVVLNIKKLIKADFLGDNVFPENETAADYIKKQSNHNAHSTLTDYIAPNLSTNGEISETYQVTDKQYTLAIVDHSGSERTTRILSQTTGEYECLWEKSSKENSLANSKGWGALHMPLKKINPTTGATIIWKPSEIRSDSIKLMPTGNELRCALLNLESGVKYFIFNINTVHDTSKKLVLKESVSLERPKSVNVAETFPVYSSFSKCGNYLFILYEDTSLIVFDLKNSKKPNHIFCKKVPHKFFDENNQLIDKKSLNITLEKEQVLEISALVIGSSRRRIKLFEIEAMLPILEIFNRLSQRMGIYLNNPLTKINDLTKINEPIHIRTLIGKQFSVKINREKGSKHEEHGFTYNHDYGELNDNKYISGDGEVLDVHFFTKRNCKKDEIITGRCIGYIHRLSDIEDKLLVIPENESFDWSRGAIQSKLEYYETAFHKVIYYFSDEVNYGKNTEIKEPSA